MITIFGKKNKHWRYSLQKNNVMMQYLHKPAVFLIKKRHFGRKSK
jgi:hypothetical protein